MKSLCVLMILLGGAMTSVAQEDFAMPTDDTIAMFTFDYTGGFRMRPPAGFEKKPQLQVFSSGRVLRSPTMPNLPSAEFKMTEAELKSFLERVVNQYKLYEISEDGIRKAIDAKKEHIRIADAPNVNVSIRLGRGDHQLSVYAVSFASKQFPDIEPLANLAKIETECRVLMGLADIGGYEEMENILSKVNAKLAEKHPDVTKMTLKHFRFASTNSEGVMHATFGLREEDFALNVVYKRLKSGDDEVTVQHFPTIRRNSK